MILVELSCGPLNPAHSFFNKEVRQGGKPFLARRSTMKKSVIQLLCVLLVLGISAPVWAQDDPTTIDETVMGNTQMEQLEDVALNRDLYIADILVTWDTDPEIARDLENELASADDGQILALLSAESMDEVRQILQGSAVFPDGLDGPAALGDLSEDLVYTPVSPCRLVDTRLVGGWLNAGTSREFFAHGLNLNTSQGGAASCISPVGEPSGVHINISVVPETTSPGNVRVYPANVSTPNAAVVNFNPDVNIANAVTVKSAYLFGRDIEVYTTQRASVVIDVMGYYSPPERTRPDSWIGYSSAVTVLNNATANVYSPYCPTGYRLSGGGHLWSHFDAGVFVVGSRATPTGYNSNSRWIVQVRNSTGINRTMQAYVVCQRIPGR